MSAPEPTAAEVAAFNREEGATTPEPTDDVPQNRAEEAIRVGAKIVEARALLAQLEAKFYRLIGARASIPQGGARVYSRSKDGSISERIKAFSKAANDARPGETFGLPEIFAAMPDADQKSVRGTLGRLSIERDGIEWVRRGRYRYPNMVRP